MWQIKADDATCFQVFTINQDYIVHEELNITRIGKDGQIQWQNSGADIFTREDENDNFKIDNEVIEVRDWENKIYKVDLNGRTIL